MGKMDKTLENMAAIYIAEHIDNLRSSHKARQVITRDVLPHLPNKKISKIKRHHIGLMLAAHKNRHGTRAIAFRQSRAMFNWLHNFGYVKRSPMAGMSAPAPLKSRERYLSDKEIKLLWRATRTAGGAFKSLYRVGLLTGQRRGECAGMHAREIKGNWWTIPGHRTKNSHENQIYLSDFTRSQLHDGPYMTNPAGHKPLTGSSNAHRRILRAMCDDIDYFVYHDLRRTMATRMPELGIKEGVTSRLLNHSSETGAMSKIYNRYDYKKERRQALLIWSDYVQNLVSR